MVKHVKVRGERTARTLGGLFATKGKKLSAPSGNVLVWKRASLGRARTSAACRTFSDDEVRTEDVWLGAGERRLGLSGKNWVGLSAPIIDLDGVAGLQRAPIRSIVWR